MSGVLLLNADISLWFDVRHVHAYGVLLPYCFYMSASLV